MLNDVRYALRALVARRGFTVATALVVTTVCAAWPSARRAATIDPLQPVKAS